MSDAYSPWKALRHLDVLHGARHGTPARPAHVQLVLSDVCNQSCLHCAYRWEGYTSNEQFHAKDQIDYLKALEILDDCAEMGVNGVQFTGGGEPTCHPRFLSVLEHARDKGLATSLVSNGVLVSRKGMSADIARACSWVRISLDAAKPETYKRVRRTPASHWEAALTTIEELRRERDAANSGCVIGVGFVVTPDNWREMYDAAHLARNLGADNLRLSAMFSPDDEQPFAGFYDEAAELARQAEGLSRGRFTVFNRFGARLDDLKQKRPDYRVCGYQHWTTYVGADLNVYRCCVYSYNSRGLIGSLKDRSFKALWMDPERAKAMRAFNPGACERCQFNNINRMLAYALDDEPQMHEEFV